MKKCPFCDANIEDSAHFCLYCMRSLTKKERVIPHQKKKPQWIIIIAVAVVSVILVTLLLPTVLERSQLHAAPSSTPAEEGTRSSEPVTESTSQSSEPVTESASQSSEPVTESTSQPTEPVTKPSAPVATDAVTDPDTEPDYYDKGTCGDNLQWILKLDGTFCITGTGAMYDYSYDTVTDETNIPWYTHRKEITAISIGAGVTRIGKWVFRDCSNLTSLVIPNGVTEIGGYAFWICTGLETVEIPETVQTIGAYAFYKCSALKQVIIPEGVTTLPGQAFYQCAKLATVTLPKSLVSIGDNAFRGCFALTDIYYAGTLDQWNTITVGTNNNPLTKATLHIPQP